MHERADQSSIRVNSVGAPPRDIVSAQLGTQKQEMRRPSCNKKTRRRTATVFQQRSSGESWEQNGAGPCPCGAHERQKLWIGEPRNGYRGASGLLCKFSKNVHHKIQRGVTSCRAVTEPRHQCSNGCSLGTVTRP